MRGFQYGLICLLLALAGCAVGTDDIGSVSLDLTPSRCFVTGGGTTANGDSFGGNAMFMRDGSTQGHWTSETAAGDLLEGEVDRLRCTQNGGNPAYPPVAPQLARFDGSGSWNGAPDHLFVVFTEDRGEPTNIDYYEIRVFDSASALVYRGDGFVTSGNVQHHSTNPGHP